MLVKGMFFIIPAIPSFLVGINQFKWYQRLQKKKATTTAHASCILFGLRKSTTSLVRPIRTVSLHFSFKSYSFAQVSAFLIPNASATYPKATGFAIPPPPSANGNGGFRKDCVKKTGWHVAGS